MWVKSYHSFLCLLDSFPVLFFSCFVHGVWFDYHFLQTVSLGLVLHYNCGRNEVSVNAFWCLKLPWSPLLVQLCHPLSWQFVWPVILLSWHVVRWNICTVMVQEVNLQGSLQSLLIDAKCVLRASVERSNVAENCREHPEVWHACRVHMVLCARVHVGNVWVDTVNIQGKMKKHGLTLRLLLKVKRHQQQRWQPARLGTSL